MQQPSEFPQRGDDVRVSFITHDGKIWHNATVLHCSVDRLKVRFASGFEYTVPHGEKRYERILNQA